MDDGFPLEFWHSDHFWLDAPISIPGAETGPISAFAPYLPRPPTVLRRENNHVTTAATATAANSVNVNRRVIEYWRKHWDEKKEEAADVEDLEREKGHRHMLNERMRRGKLRQSFLELHSILPNKTKNDKDSIVQMAARKIEELKAFEESLKRRNQEVEMAIEAKKRKKEKGKSEIRVTLANPSSGINSMLVVLNVLKTVGVNAKAIHATFLDSEFSAQLAIDTHMRAAEVERALQMTITEVDRKFQTQCREGSS